MIQLYFTMLREAITSKLHIIIYNLVIVWLINTIIVPHRVLRTVWQYKVHRIALPRSAINKSLVSTTSSVNHSQGLPPLQLVIYRINQLIDYTTSDLLFMIYHSRNCTSRFATFRICSRFLKFSKPCMSY